MGKDAPDPPDYQSLAQQQAQADKQNMVWQTTANRPTQSTPWGTSQWTIDPATGKSVQNVSLPADAQRALEAQQGVQADLSGTARQLTSRVSSDLANPVDYGDFQDYGQLGDYDARRKAAEDAAYGRASSRLDPYWEQQTNDMDIQLRGQGLMPGDEAYDRAMQNLERGRNDAYALAQADSVAAGRAESDLAYRQQLGTAEYQNTLRQSQIAEELQKRGWTINEINSLLTGREVQSPNLPSFTNSSKAAAPELLKAGELTYQGEVDQFNAKQAQMQGLFSGLSSAFTGMPTGAY